MKSIVALIPARSGSKGVPHKNIKSLGGRPLIEWSIQACLKSRLIDRVIISTDSQEYADVAIKLGAEAPFLRPIEFAGDRSTDFEFVLHALDWFANHGGEPNYLVHMRPTTPYRAPEVIDQAIEAFQRQTKATALRSVHEMPESAYKTFEISLAGQLKLLGSDSTALDAANNARQQFPATYIANGYVDVLSTAFIRKKHLIHGDHVLPFLTATANEVDTPEDFFRLEMELENHPEFATRLFN